jgi:hypothetical protein
LKAAAQSIKYLQAEPEDKLNIYLMIAVEQASVLSSRIMLAQGERTKQKAKTKTSTSEYEASAPSEH